MNEWLTDKEKRLLLHALSKEKKVCAEVDKLSHREPDEETLVSVIESLEHKFYYDRLFKKMEKQIRADAIEQIKQIITESEKMMWNSDKTLQKIKEQLKEEQNDD